jgi:hypothetical protein
MGSSEMQKRRQWSGQKGVERKETTSLNKYIVEKINKQKKERAKTDFRMLSHSYF